MDISLNSHEARVFGVLIEKGYTTPDQYPLSLNAATNGSNQKSNRDPQVDFSEAEVRRGPWAGRSDRDGGRLLPVSSIGFHRDDDWQCQLFDVRITPGEGGRAPSALIRTGPGSRRRRGTRTMRSVSGWSTGRASR